MNNEPAPEKLLLNAKEVAAALGLGESTVWDFHARGLLPLPIKLNRRTLWRAAELKAWTEAGCPARQKWISMQGARA